MPSNADSFQLKLYFYREFLIMKGTTVSFKNCGRSFKNCGRIIWTKYQSSVLCQK